MEANDRCEKLSPSHEGVSYNLWLQTQHNALPWFGFFFPCPIYPTPLVATSSSLSLSAKEERDNARASHSTRTYIYIYMSVYSLERCKFDSLSFSLRFVLKPDLISSLRQLSCSSRITVTIIIVRQTGKPPLSLSLLHLHTSFLSVAKHW